MSKLQTGHDKVKEICEAIKQDALNPAQQEASGLLDDARMKAEQVVANAKHEAETLIANARTKIAQEKSVFQSTLTQASKQSMEALRQSIEHTLFNDQLDALIAKSATDNDLVAKLISAMVNAVDKEGLSCDFSALVPKTFKEEVVNHTLLASVKDKLREKGVVIGDFDGGAKLRLNDKKVTIDISDHALKELLTRYVRKDFRKLLFGE